MARGLFIGGILLWMKVGFKVFEGIQRWTTVVMSNDCVTRRCVIFVYHLQCTLANSFLHFPTVDVRLAEKETRG